jgi:hypothetical protein
MTMEAARALLSRLFRSTSSEPKDADRNDRDTSQGANKSTVQASGNGTTKGAPDGVSASPSGSERANIQGRSAGGESGGGAYPNPKSGKAGTNSGFMGHGGQTDIGYHGGEQAGDNGGTTPNATTRGKDDYAGPERSR